MKSVWLVVAVTLVVCVIGKPNASATERNGVPFYDGKPGETVGDACVNPKDGAEMVWVTAGEFLMGLTDEQAEKVLRLWPEDARELMRFFLDASKPQRTVSLDGYWIYKYPVTVAQYRAFCRESGREMPEEPLWSRQDQHAMSSVSWENSAEYAAWAGAFLPTEAQWEKAAVGTDGRLYPWGNEWDGSKCPNSVGDMLHEPALVGSHPQGVSPYGAMDVAGGVLEWCRDWYDTEYHDATSSQNPIGPAESTTLDLPRVGSYPGGRSVRGGSWTCQHAGSYVSGARGSLNPSERDPTVGFRCVVIPSDPASGKPIYDGKPGNEAGEVRINPRDGAEMVWVPAGEFLMGSSDRQIEKAIAEHSEWQLENVADETPQRRVHLDGYWVYKYPVTVAQYWTFCKTTQRKMASHLITEGQANHPATFISWDDAMAYAEWGNVSLPTEAQWEKAARGIDGRVHPWGDEWDASKCANGMELASFRTEPVGSYPDGASPYGAMDMAGLVWEWCLDYYDPNYYKVAPSKNPPGPDEGVVIETTGPTGRRYENPRVQRGGASFNEAPGTFRCADRSFGDPAWAGFDNGFRCVAVPNEVARAPL